MSPGGRPARRQLDGVDDLGVPGAAADVAGQRLADLEDARLWHAPQQVVRRHHQARSAEAALDGATLDEGLLDTGGIDALNRDDPSAVGLAAEHEARADQHAVEIHGTGAALSLLASVLRTEETEPLAQDIQQTLARPHVDGGPLLSVHRTGDVHVAHAQARHRRAIT